MMEVTTNHTVRLFYNAFFFAYPCINFFLKNQKKCLIKEVNKVAAGELLEIGVGNGSHINFYGQHRVTGIDTSEKMIAIANKKTHHKHSLYLMDGEQMTFTDNIFDYIIISHVLSVTTDPNQMLSEACRILRSGGKLFILNHFTPPNWLRFIDKAFNPISHLFRFKSYFHITDLHLLSKFNHVDEIISGRLGYYKLLVCTK